MLGLRICPNFVPPLFPPPKSNPIQNPNFPAISKSVQLNHRPHSKQFRINAKNDDLPTEKVKNGGAKSKIRWVDRDPENLVAVGLTGLLTWASVQVLWQLFVISTSILIAALKYSVVAALLIFTLITLL